MGSLGVLRNTDTQNNDVMNERLPSCSRGNNRLEGKMAANEKETRTDRRAATAPPPHRSDRERENVRRIAKDLAIDIVYYVSNYKKLTASSRHAKTLRRTVNELLDRHSILFKGMVKKLDISNHNGKSTFTNVADEMFADKTINWGRIVSVYAFGGRLAKHCADKHMYDYIDKIATFLGDYVADNLSEWILTHGGWDKFDEYFLQEATLESRLWQGLLVTAVGLGALATMVAVK